MFKPKNLDLISILLISAGVFLGSCSADRQVSRKVNRLFKQSEVLKKYFVGFALYDLSAKKMVLEKNADKYFTPASNTKLFTFYAGLKMLPDSVPALRFIEQGDSLIFWGTGDPSLLHAALKGVKVLDFLRATDKRIFFAPGRYKGDFYGKGWQWDDYNADYQAEINELPAFGNLADVKISDGKMEIVPKLFTACFVADPLSNDTLFSVIRAFNENKFKYPAMHIPASYHQQVPFKVSTSTTLALLSDTLGKEIRTIDMRMPSDAKTLYGLKTEDVLREMMLPSDNFIAEQLLLVYGNQIGVDLNTENTIGYIEKNYLKSLPDKPLWVDGSGLSRGNLFTPGALVKLLELIYAEFKDPYKLYGMLPAGGNAGTLKNTYPATSRPFVFGKTGTLSNNHNQSGYIITKKKKTYIFSFMNNNFVLPAADVSKEMVRIVTYVHVHF